MAVLQNEGEAAKGDQKGRRGGIRNKDPSQSDIFKIVKMIMERNFAPVIVFSFSKKDCELYATQMTKLDFNTSKFYCPEFLLEKTQICMFVCYIAQEKQLVDEVFSNAMDVLSEDDRHLPQVDNLLPLLRRGISHLKIF